MGDFAKVGAKIIDIEETEGQFQIEFQRVMRMVPDRDRGDENLRRLVAFRLRTDGENATRDYLIAKIREMIQCADNGCLYDFLKDDTRRKACNLGEDRPDPPDIA
jgi:hypothetical protein